MRGNGHGFTTRYTYVLMYVSADNGSAYDCHSYYGCPHVHVVLYICSVLGGLMVQL